MIVYLAGPITGVADYRQRFDMAERKLTDLGYSVHRVTAGSRKDTCCQCGKRRFCYDFEVGRKAERSPK